MPGPGVGHNRASDIMRLDELDIVTLLNCVHELHTRETSALRTEVARLTALHPQHDSAAATATGKNVAESTWLAQASRIEEPPCEPHLSFVEESSAKSIWPAQVSRSEEKPNCNSDVSLEQEEHQIGSNGSDNTAADGTGAVHSQGSTKKQQNHGCEAGVQMAKSRSRSQAGDQMAKIPSRSQGLSAGGSFGSSVARPSRLNASIGELLSHGQNGEDKPANLPQAIIRSPYFDAFISVIIALNVITIALETEYRGLIIESGLKSSAGEGGADPRPEWPGAEDIFRVLEWVFGFVFWGELLLRAYCERLKLFRSYLAWLDMIVAVSWTVGKVGMLGDFNPTVLRAVRVMRAMRLVKLLRVIEAFDSLQLMTTACVGSMTALMWFTVILTLVLTFCALLTTEVLHQYYFVDPGEENRWDIYDSDSTYGMFLCFGTFTRCLFSMYELALANWPPLGRMLSEEVSQWFMLFTVGHKLVIGFAMVGVINGIFMQETLACVAIDDDTMVRQKKRQGRALKMKMQRLFKLADADGNGTISLQEFLTILEYREVRTWLCSLGFDSHDIETAFWMLAGDDGRITEEELVEGVEHLRGPARSIDVVSILTMGSLGKNAIRALEDVRAGPQHTKPSQSSSDANVAGATESLV